MQDVNWKGTLDKKALCCTRSEQLKLNMCFFSAKNDSEKDIEDRMLTSLLI